MVIRIYRASRWLLLHRVPLLPRLLYGLNRIVFGVVLPPSASLGRGVLLSYKGLGTVIHKRAVIGDYVIIGSGVTIGGRSGKYEVPVIAERAVIGSGAKVLGPVTIGKHASIGANAVVLNDVPAFGVAVGIPARTVKINELSSIPDYFKFMGVN